MKFKALNEGYGFAAQHPHGFQAVPYKGFRRVVIDAGKGATLEPVTANAQKFARIRYRNHGNDLRVRIDAMRRAADEAGRDPDAIEVSAGGGGRSLDDVVARAEQLRDLGVTRMLLGVMPPDQILATGEALRARLGD